MEERVRAYTRLRLTQAREELQTARENVALTHYRTALSSGVLRRLLHGFGRPL